MVFGTTAPAHRDSDLGVLSGIRHFTQLMSGISALQIERQEGLRRGGRCNF